MLVEKVSYKNTHLFSKLMEDYLYDTKKIAPLFRSESSLDQFATCFQNKSFSMQQRITLYDTLIAQYPSLSERKRQQLELIKLPNTYTICTAHQPLLMGGPLYFIHKIASCIKLCSLAKARYPEYNFIPIYWMGSEDHDIDEVNHLYLFNNKLQWTVDKGGPVGKKLLDASIIELKTSIKQYLGTSSNATTIYDHIDSSYQLGDSLAESTRKFVYALFSAYDLLVLDQNDVTFKRQMIPVFKEEISEHKSSKLIAENLQYLEANYAVQATPREINLFYLSDTLRERIVEEQGRFKVNNTGLTFSKEELLEEIEKHPEHFSPNVILRPLYQETILPNIAFVGGAGEIAYWLQLKPIFDHYQIQYPMLIMRDMALYSDEKTWNRFKQKGFEPTDIFKDIHDLEKSFMAKNHSIENLFLAEKNRIVDEYDHIAAKIDTIDKTLITTVNAEKQKILNSITMLEAKSYKALKKKSDDDLSQILKAKNKIYPNGELQERYDNFMMYYLQFGDEYISMLVETMNAFENEVKIMVY